MPLPAFTPESRQRLLESQKKRRSAREAATEHLGNGWLLAPDSPPGVGWVLMPPSSNEHGTVLAGGGSPRRYYATREAAIARHRELASPAAPGAP